MTSAASERRLQKMLFSQLSFVGGPIGRALGMDWSSDDYSRVYADTFLTPPSESGTGIYLFNEDEPEPYSCPENFGRRDRRPPRQERYYTGGNIVSDRGDSRAIFNVAWDERPQSYNSDRLVPPFALPTGSPSAHRRPTGGPPAHRRPTGGPPALPIGSPPVYRGPLGSPSTESFSGAAGHTCDCDREGRAVELKLQHIKVFLLIVIVILHAMVLVSAGRMSRRLENAIRATPGAASHQPAHQW